MNKPREEKKRYFPCPICKGQGGWHEAILDDGSGPYDECGYCQGEGLIEIRGKRHQELRKENIAMQAITYFANKEEWEHKEIVEIGEEIRKIISSKELL